MAMLCRELILRFDLQMLFLVTAFVLCSEWVHVDTIIALDVIGTTAERCIAENAATACQSKYVKVGLASLVEHLKVWLPRQNSHEFHFA